jgi:outer membrane receptor protein involved in Fe transport
MANHTAGSIPHPAGLRPRLRALAALVLCASVAHAASVRGTFVGGSPAVPLEGVEVVLRRAADSTVVAHATTGADGRFRVDSLRFDHYLLRASLVGYEPWRRSDVILGETAPDLDLGRNALAVSAIALTGVDVTTERATAIIAPDRNIYLTKDMPAATTSNATDVLRSVPELDVDIDGHVSLRGSSSVNIQFNGRVSPLKDHDLERYLQGLPGGRIERVEVMANPSAKYDPEGTGGIVNIVLRDDVDMGLSGNFTVTLGSRYSSPRAHVAWQSGRITAFGGFSGSLSHWNYATNLLRKDFLTAAPSSFASNSDYTYKDRYGNVDASVDVALTKRAKLYGTINGYLGSGNTHALNGFAITDSSQVETSRYVLVDDDNWGGRTPSITLGLQHVVQGGRDEREIEYLESGTDGDNHYSGYQRTQIPVGTDDQVTRVAGNNDYRRRSLQIDDTHPLGGKGTVGLGYKGSERFTNNASGLLLIQGSAGPTTDGSAYEDRERLDSGYLTLGQTVGRVSVQLGARGEVAKRTFDAHSMGASYDHDYKTLFPSASAAWDFGLGRTLRATYSKRIERPASSYLNPDVPVKDSLDRFVGNPYLDPKYTHSYSVDAIWTGSRGSLRLSPYFRDTINNWDLITTVDAGGAATSTWQNASSVRVLGASITGSLRQVNRLGGTMSMGVTREHHDASNVSDSFLRDLVSWSMTGNVVYKTTKTIDLQTSLRFNPKRVLAQGYATAYVGSSIGAHWRPSDKLSGGLTINDPFNLAYWSNSEGDPTFAETSTTHNHTRSVSGSLTWSWGGKPPEEQQRRQHGEQPQPDTPGQ